MKVKEATNRREPASGTIARDKDGFKVVIFRRRVRITDVRGIGKTLLRKLRARREAWEEKRERVSAKEEKEISRLTSRSRDSSSSFSLVPSAHRSLWLAG